MVNGTGLYPQAGAEAGEVPAVGPAGARLLTGTVRATGLDTALSGALAPWRKPLAVHDPGKIIVDLALCAALGGRALSDLAVLRGQGELFGPVASDPTVCRLMKTLAGDADAVEAAVEAARGEVRRRVWSLAGEHSPAAGISAESPLVIDVDATLVEAHWAKEGAAPTFKGGFGYHPLTAWFDHGPDGAGQCAAIMLRPGNAGANTAADSTSLGVRTRASTGSARWSSRPSPTSRPGESSTPRRLFRGGFEDVEREGRGDGPVVGTVPRPTPLRPCWSSCMVGRRLACRDAAGSRARHPGRRARGLSDDLADRGARRRRAPDAEMRVSPSRTTAEPPWSNRT